MTCENCGFESEQDFSQCPNCQGETQLVATPQTVADRILPALKDTLFLVICVLMSASCLIALTLGDLPLISILATVFLWLTYAQSRKDITDAKQLRCVSGTIYAQYVITYVVAGLFLLLGILFAVVFSFLMQDQEFMNSLLSMFIEVDEATLALLETIASVSSIIILIAFAMVSVIIVLVNIFTTRYIHRFVKSVYKSIEANALELKHTNAAKICLFIISAFSAISALSSFGSFLVIEGLGSAVTCAVTLIAGLLIQKYFSSKE